MVLETITERGILSDNNCITIEDNTNTSSFNLTEGSVINHNRFGRGQVLKIEGVGNDRKAEIKFDQGDVEDTLTRVVDATNHQSTVEILDRGPKTRGKERNKYTFKDGLEGDVYRCILRAIKENSSLSIEYARLKTIIDQECIDGSPTGSSIISSCEKMDDRLKEEFPDERYLEWDPAKKVLSIPDPYLLFYLRWANWESKLEGTL